MSSAFVSSLPCHHVPQLLAEAQRPCRRKADQRHPRTAQRHRRQLRGHSSRQPWGQELPQRQPRSGTGRPRKTRRPQPPPQSQRQAAALKRAITTLDGQVLKKDDVLILNGNGITETNKL